MVSGGINKDGLGKLIFHIGNVKSFSNITSSNFIDKILIIFLEKFSNKTGTRAHSSKSSQNDIKKLFEDNFISTWESEPLNNEKISQK